MVTKGDGLWAPPLSIQWFANITCPIECSSVGNSAFTMTKNLRAFSSLLSDDVFLCGTVQDKNLFTEDSEAMEGHFKRPFLTNKYSAGFDALK